MRLRNSYGIIIFGLGLGLHLLAYVKYGMLSEEIRINSFLVGQFYLLLLVSLFLFSSILVCRTRSKRLLILCVHILVFLVIGYPLGSEIEIELYILVVLILETYFAFGGKAGLIISHLLILLFTFVQQPAVVFNHELPATDKVEIYLKAGYAAIVTALAASLSFILQKADVQEQKMRIFDSTINALNTSNRDFVDYAITAREKAEIDERKRITREIHDAVGYVLTNIMMMQESAEDFLTMDPDKTRNLLRLSREQAVQGLEDTRSTLRELRKIEKPTNGANSIQNLVKTFAAATSIDIRIEYNNVKWCYSEEVDSIIYHTIQEGMVNAIRHGQADQIIIRLWESELEVGVYVVDNGKGSQNIVHGIGLTGIGERLQKIGGNFHANNRVGGFELGIRIPYHKEEETS
jgi:signal transduction histidine kinase